MITLNEYADIHGLDIVKIRRNRRDERDSTKRQQTYITSAGGPWIIKGSKESCGQAETEALARNNLVDRMKKGKSLDHTNSPVDQRVIPVPDDLVP